MIFIQAMRLLTSAGFTQFLRAVFPRKVHLCGLYTAHFVKIRPVKREKSFLPVLNFTQRTVLVLTTTETAYHFRIVAFPRSAGPSAPLATAAWTAPSGRRPGREMRPATKREATGKWSWILCAGEKR